MKYLLEKISVDATDMAYPKSASDHRVLQKITGAL